MSLPPIPPPTEGATRVRFDTAAAERALARLSTLRTSLAAIDTAARSAGNDASATWTGVSGTWFREQLASDAFTTTSARATVDATETAITGAANRAVADQIENNRIADWNRAVEQQRAAEAAPGGQ